MNPSEHLAYFGEHEVSKKFEISLLAKKVLSNFGDQYVDTAEIQAMKEIDIARSLLEVIGEHEVAEKLREIEEYINQLYHN
jgi:hypothetical protein